MPMLLSEVRESSSVEAGPCLTSFVTSCRCPVGAANFHPALIHELQESFLNAERIPF